MSVSLFGKDSVTGSNDPVSISSNNLHVAQYIWDINTLSWIKQTGSSGAAGTDVTVTNFPATQTVSGTVAATQSGTWLINTKNNLTSNAPSSASVGITSSQILAANANRKGLVLVNTSSANISLGFGTAAVLNSGITLYPGGAFNMDEYCFTTSAITAIASAATSNLGIQEWQ